MIDDSRPCYFCSKWGPCPDCDTERRRVMNPTDVIFKPQPVRSLADEIRKNRHSDEFRTSPDEHPPLIDEIAAVWPEVAKHLRIMDADDQVPTPVKWWACRACVEEKVRADDKCWMFDADTPRSVLEAQTPAEWAVAVRALIDAIGGGE